MKIVTTFKDHAIATLKVLSIIAAIAVFAFTYC